ncbi:MAG: response regulator [Candidatus Paracaedimonas acanthamoebae]|mgnify:CR=1 FL=1|uniref:Response regulator n=1 Tax=Candidatus Paracaedimonas acanthamoebae TaxID=244581 RepID=A0A8J7PXH9_9PROT|nr:response regulator [Candidatus Paracaedimonas acanthamoebae]
MHKILMVDDEPDLDILIQQGFRKEIRDGIYSFIFARHGAAALELIEKNPDVKLVLTDLNMPEMNGLELLRRLKHQYSDVKVLILSAYGDQESRSVALSAGAVDFLTKPIVFSELQTKLNALLS